MTLREMFEDSRGISFIEILLVVAITSIAAAASVPIIGNLQKSSQLAQESTQIIQTVRIAKERASSRLNNASHGVYFQPSYYTLYQGASYAVRDSSYDRTLVLDNALSLSTNLTGDEVNFSKGLGEPDTTGTITLTHSVQGIKIITINSFGKVEE